MIFQTSRMWSLLFRAEHHAGVARKSLLYGLLQWKLLLVVRGVHGAGKLQ